MTEEEKKYLSTPETLEEWAPYSLFDRCRLFKNRFNKKLRQNTLRNFYLESSIGFRAISYIKRSKIDRKDEISDRTLEFAKKLIKAR